MPPVIPGGPTGYGMDTRAAYGGSGTPGVYRVTKLTDDGSTGTLRWACSQGDNSVVIFETSGYIELGSDIVINNSYVTIAGQTAPAPGIEIKNYGLYSGGHDILLQHLCIRPGGNTCNSGMQIYQYPNGAQHHIILDHCSFSWGQDENIACNYSYGTSGYVTIYRCISAEGLYQAPGSGSCPGGGLANGHAILCAGDSGRTAIVQCLMASCIERNPYVLGGTQVAMVNNVVYQWFGLWGLMICNGSASSGGTQNIWYVTAAGNRFIQGPGTLDGGSAEMIHLHVNGGDSLDLPGNQLYDSDNTIANQDGNIIPFQNMYSYDPRQGAPPSLAPMPGNFTLLGSTAVEAFVLAKAGSRPAEANPIDVRIKAKVTNRNGNFISHPNDVGGYPSLAVNTRALTTPSNPHIDAGSGYTNLEVWLHGYAAAVEGEAVDTTDLDLATGRVFVNASFTGTAGLDLTAYTSEVGGGWTLQTGSTGVLELSNANRLLNTSTGLAALTVAQGVPVSGEYDVDADFRVLTLISGSNYAIWGRAETTSVTGYLGVYSVDAMSWQLIKVVNGTFGDPVLGTYSQVLSTNTTYHVTLLIREGAQELWIDGVHRIGATDTEITTRGNAGISVYATTTADTNTTGIHIDNFLATDVRDYPYVWPKGGGM